MNCSKYDHKVLLAIRAGRIDPRLLVSTRSLCQRMEAGLDILMIAGDEALPVEVVDLIKMLREDGMTYTLTRKPILRRRDIVDYANTRECISTVVIDSLEGWESMAADRTANPWTKLACPLVTAASAKTPNN